MSRNLKDRLGSVAEAAKGVGQKIAAGAVHAVHYVREKAGMETDLGIVGIQPGMEVIASCGSNVGIVDSLDGHLIKLTKEYDPIGIHHYIPVQWVERVNSAVHLNKSLKETELQWKQTNNPG